MLHCSITMSTQKVLNRDRLNSLVLIFMFQANLFYSGCIIVELRDFRRSASSDFDMRYVLLRPTPHVSQSS